MKEKMKRFWTLRRAANAGFTLVELIVVIAILAILAGVAVPAYSAYVKQANIQADETLVAEIKNALTLAYYSGKVTTGSVILTVDGVTPSDDKVREALTDAFGSLEGLTLKYDKHNFEYTESSFIGKETALLGKVDTLTDLLGDVLSDVPGLVGEEFSEYLKLLGVDSENTDAVADAAVLYVAQNAAKMDDAKRQATIDAMVGLSSVSDPMEAAVKLVQVYDGSYIAAAAGLYAFAEGYCQYEKANGNDRPLEILNEETAKITSEGISQDNQIQAVMSVLNAFGAVQQEVTQNTEIDYTLDEYFEGQAAKDSAAYLDILKTVSGVQDSIKDSLGEENCFSSQAVSSLLDAYANGGIMIQFGTDKNDAFYCTSSIDD